ncbi:MAG: T9SS type A sorting domain-containing protein [Flavobacteriales bacterium]|nr:T9SS type A sorting domain-containing protein [Flavobacteriales bacterium]
MRYFLFFFVLCLSLNIHAQLPNYSWAKSLDVDNNGGYIVDIATDKSGNFYVIGDYLGTIDLDPGPGIANFTNIDGAIFIAKYTSEGDFIWGEDFETVNNSGFCQSITIEVSVDNNVYILGAYDYNIDLNPGIGTDDVISIEENNVFVVKLDSNGAYLWGKVFESDVVSFLGADDIAVNSSGDFYIVGGFKGNMDVDPGASSVMINCLGIQDTYVAKYDSDGNYLWHHKQGKEGAANLFRAVKVDSDDNMYVSGYFRDTVDVDPSAGVYNLITPDPEMRNLCIQKYTPNGELIWAGSMVSFNIVDFNDMAIDEMNNISIVGEFYESTNIGLNNPPVYINTTSVNRDGFVVKYDSAGVYKWHATYKDSSNFPQDPDLVIFDENGNTIVVGEFRETVDFDPGPGVVNLTSGPNSYDSFIQQLDSNGNFLWVGGWFEPNNNRESFFSFSAGVNGNLYLVGAIADTVDLNPSNDIDIHFPSELVWQPLVLCLSTDESVGVKDGINQVLNTKVYPNPFLDNVKIELEKNYETVELKLLDVKGNVIQSKSYFNSSLCELKLDVPKGVYFIEVRTEYFVKIQKIVKQ